MKSQLGMESTATHCSRGHRWDDNNRREWPKRRNGVILEGQFVLQCRTCNNESKRRNYDPEKERARKKKERS